MKIIRRVYGDVPGNEDKHGDVPGMILGTDRGTCQGMKIMGNVTETCQGMKILKEPLTATCQE
jgi:hypothetical protein